MSKDSKEHEDMRTLIKYADIIKGYPHAGFFITGYMTEQEVNDRVKQFFRKNNVYSLRSREYRSVDSMMEVLSMSYETKEVTDILTVCFGDDMTGGVWGTFPTTLFTGEGDTN